MSTTPDFNNIMKEAQQLQKRMQDAQESLVKLEVEGVAGNGLVKVKINGQHDVLKVDVNERLLDDGDVEMLQDLIKASFNDAVQKLLKLTKERISQLTAGFNIPSDLLKDKDNDN